MKYNPFLYEGRFTDYPLEMESVEDDDDLPDFDFGDTYLNMEFED